MTNKETTFPVISEALLVELNTRFPERCPDIEWDEKTVWFVSGQRAVVRFMNQIYTEQNENVLAKKE